MNQRNVHVVLVIVEEDHMFSANSYIVYKEIQKEEICEVKKKNFNEGKSGLSISDQLLNETIEKMSNQGKLIFKEMEEIKNSLKKLDEIAL